MKTTRIISALGLLASWCCLNAMVAYGQTANTNQFPAKTNFTTRLGDGFVAIVLAVDQDTKTITLRSEERRVGKECRSRWSPYH